MNAGSLPEGRAGQVAAVGVLFVAVVVVWVGAVGPLVGWYGARAEALGEARLEAAHLAALRAQLPALRRAAAGVDAQPAPALLVGESDAMAGANLQAALQGLAAAGGVSLDSVETVPATPVGQLRRIGVTVDLSCSWPDLVGFLAAIEAASPRMVVDDLTVAATQADPMVETPLQVSFSVYGLAGGPAGGAR